MKYPERKCPARTHSIINDHSHKFKMAETEQSKAKYLRTGVLCHNLVPKDHSEGPRNEVVFASARDHKKISAVHYLIRRARTRIFVELFPLAFSTRLGLGSGLGLVQFPHDCNIDFDILP